MTKTTAGGGSPSRASSTSKPSISGICGRELDVGDYLVTSPPAVLGDVVVVGSAIGDNRRRDVESGVVRAFDARTGAPRWSFDPIPRTRDHQVVDSPRRRKTTSSRTRGFTRPASAPATPRPGSRVPDAPRFLAPARPAYLPGRFPSPHPPGGPAA